MNASGTFGYGDEWPRLCNTAVLGAIVTKTLTLEPRAGNPPPRLQETPSGLLNSIGLQNVGVTAFLAEHLSALRALRPPVIASVGGASAEEFAAVVERLEAGALEAYELNVSCPNVAQGGLSFGRSPGETARVVRGVRRVTQRPLFVKLTPNVTDIVAIGRAALDEGATGLTAVNTFLGMEIDLERSRPRFGRVGAGLSGPAIRPLALYRIWELARSLDCPLIGAGGIVTARDAAAFMMAGATAVQVGTATLRDPARPAALVTELATFAEARGLARIRDLVASLEGLRDVP
ncbi:MAG: dihydroorotate dehydrogenase [Candidatus Eisenbacteria sp.]|nr:dihydroorotate dehydrogenase [Candidatus Eisenbacteria bacterium]